MKVGNAVSHNSTNQSVGIECLRLLSVQEAKAEVITMPAVPDELQNLVRECARGNAVLHIVSVDAKNKQSLHVFDNRTKQGAPACFDSDEQWHEWASQADLSESPRYQYCIDCTPAYQDKMHAAGRCAHPDAVLVNDLPGA